MIDFTSALYLGMTHASYTLPPWERLTEARPAALEERPEDEATGSALAELQGCQAGVLSASTLHLFWDLGGLMAGAALLVDDGAYAIGKWGAERAAACGASVSSFVHHEPAALHTALASLPASRRTIVICDGFCPGCGQSAPLASYLELVRARGGWLLVDDTQALGIWGSSPSEGQPYGVSGGGSLRRWAIADENVLLVSSLAKGFGAPLAALTGSRRAVAAFRERSLTRERCSPPSAAGVRAAAAALRVNRQQGGELRLRLAERVRWFRASLEERGIQLGGGLFPVQSLATVGDPERMHRVLLRQGIRTVLHRARRDSPGQISFILTAAHPFAELRTAVRATAEALRRTQERGCGSRRESRRKAGKPCGLAETERT